MQLVPIFFTIIQVFTFLGCAQSEYSSRQYSTEQEGDEESGRVNVKDLEGWAPNSETNCAATALYADERIDDLMHVDPDELSQFVLPYCYERTQELVGATLVIGFGTSQDQVDYRRLLHVFHLASNGLATNKAGATDHELFEIGTFEEFGNMDSYFDAMSQALQQPVKGEVELYRFRNDNRCPLNNYSAAMKKYVAEIVFFQTQQPILSKFKAKDSDLSLNHILPKKDLIEAHERIEKRIESLSAKIFPIYEATALQHGRVITSRKDLIEIFPLVTMYDSIEILNEYFFLRLARKQVRMALGIRELDPLPAP